MATADKRTRGIQSDQGSIQQQLAAPESALTKYQRTVVGDRSLGWLLCYEAAVFCFGSIKGNAGTLLRRLAYKPFFKHTGRKFDIGPDSFLRRPHLCSFGDFVHAGARVSMEVKNNGQAIQLGDNVVVGEATIFSCPGGVLSVGARTRIGAFCRLGSMLGLDIGTDCSIGDYSYIVGAGHHVQSLDRPIIQQPITCSGPNRVGNNVSIGSRVTVLDGIAIGDNATIADGTLVTRGIPANAYVEGVPGRITMEGE